MGVEEVYVMVETVDVGDDVIAVVVVIAIVDVVMAEVMVVVVMFIVVVDEAMTTIAVVVVQVSGGRNVDGACEMVVTTLTAVIVGVVVL